MWDSSQEEVYFQGIPNHRGLHPSIPLIIIAVRFSLLMNSLTESWDGIPLELTAPGPGLTGGGGG
jgi:hypothetical protein